MQPYLDAKMRLEVKAPVAGQIVNMKVHTIGEVVPPRQTIMEIVPSNQKLILEAKIQVKDITHVHLGQEAEVQLVAFRTRITPNIKGKVIYISPDSIMLSTPRGQFPVYVVHIEVDEEELKKNDLYATPGMPATAFILTEERTVLEYIIEPLVENIYYAFREN